MAIKMPSDTPIGSSGGSVYVKNATVVVFDTTEAVVVVEVIFDRGFKNISSLQVLCILFLIFIQTNISKFK